MLRYFFVKKNDLFIDNVADDYFANIIKLSQQGKSVSVFLLQNAIAPAMKTAQPSCFDELLTKSISVYVDEFSLAQRGITTCELKPNIQTAELNVIVHAALNGEEVIWS